MKNKTKDLRYIGDRLKTYRGKKELSQTQLSELSNISITQISRYENDQAIPNVDIIERLSKALGVEAIDLVGSQQFSMDEFNETMQKLKSFPIAHLIIIKEIVDKFYDSNTIHSLVSKGK